MKRLAIALVAVAAVTGSASAAVGINSKYNVRGDRAIAPIQVFDDGQRIYLQLRRTDVPPVPIDNETGRPISYIVDGPYMVIPGLPASISLRYGQREAQIVSTTREIRSLPSGGLAPVPSGGGLYYGSAPAAKLTAPAADPIPAAAPESKQTPLAARPPVVSGSIEANVPKAPAPTVISPAVPAQEKRTALPDVAKGSFEVVKDVPKKEASTAVKGSFGVAGSVSEALRVSFAGTAARLSAAEIVRLSEFVQKHNGKTLVVEAPSSTLGEQRAAELRRQLRRLGVADTNVSTEIGAVNIVQVLAQKG